MRFFQRLNICKRCGVAFKPIGITDELCFVHEKEKQKKDFEDSQFFAWVEKNRERLQAMRVSEQKEDEKIRRENNARLAAAYGQAAAQQQSHFGSYSPDWTNQRGFGYGA